MKIIEIKSLAIPDVKVVKFGRFADERGYFTEHYRKNDLLQSDKVEFLRDQDFRQANESYSRAGTIRGLHFQWNPYMGKLVRCVSGHLVDFALDIRKNSPTLGKIIGYDLPADRGKDFDEWIWLPPGFAHGVLFPEESLIEYFCTGEYNPACEVGISPLAPDLDWSLCEPNLKAKFDEIVPKTSLISEKDKNGLTLKAWLADDRSSNFL